MDIIIRPATTDDHATIVEIGKSAVELSHRDSCSAEHMDQYLSTHYTHEAIKKELADPGNKYHIIYAGGKAAGFSKIICDAGHPNIAEQNVTKLDRIYLLDEFFGLQLGYKLLQFNIELSRKNGQCGMWLFTWVGNERAINFYLKAGFTIIGTHQFKVSETHYNPNHHMFLRYGGGECIQ